MEAAVRDAVTFLSLAYMVNLLVLVVFRLKHHWAYWIPGYPVLWLAWFLLLCVCAVVAGVAFGLAFSLAIWFRIVRCLPMLWKVETEMPPRVAGASSAPSSVGSLSADVSFDPHAALHNGLGAAAGEVGITNRNN